MLDSSPHLEFIGEPDAAFDFKFIPDEVLSSITNIFQAASTKDETRRQAYLHSAASHLSKYEEKLDELKSTHGLHPSYPMQLELMDHHLKTMQEHSNTSEEVAGSLANMLDLYVHAVLEREQSIDSELAKPAMLASGGHTARIRQRRLSGMESAQRIP